MSGTGFFSSFGPGLLVAKGLSANSQPIIFGSLQDVQLTIDAKIEMLMGQAQFPIDAAVGSRSIKGTAKIGQISMPLFNLLFSGTPATGTVKIAYAEAGTVPASTPYTITVANSATWTGDQGVVYAATGVPLTPVASNPTQGQYSVANGVYTFAAADTGAAVQITYTYTDATAGATLAVPNSPQGTQQTFGILQQASRNNVGGRILLPNCISGKLTLPTAMAKFGIASFDFEAFSAGGTASPMTIYTDV